LDFEDTITHSLFNAKERKAIYLIVSQVNQCDYCLAAHSMIAGMRGYSKDEIINFRRGIAADAKLQAAVLLAKALAETKGLAADAARDAFFKAGYDEAALVDLAALVSLRTFTNYVYALTKIPIDFPAVEKI
jgi:AhpD family alkylhydroperoxidase